MEERKRNSREAMRLQKEQELFSIENEAACSAEFSGGCLIVEQ